MSETSSALLERTASEWAPHWPHATKTLPEAAGGFHETWGLEVSDAAGGRAFLVRFGLLLSANGFQRAAEVSAVAFERGENGETQKIAARVTHGLEAFSAFRSDRKGDEGVRIGECDFSPSRSRGRIETRGATIAWDLAIEGDGLRFDGVPEALRRLRLVRHQALTLEERPRFRGTLKINGREIAIDGASGRVAHLCGPSHSHEWVRAHCSRFVDDKDQPSDLVFDGITARLRAGRFGLPAMSSFFFHYRGERHEFSTLRDLARLRSRSSLTSWEFQAERGGVAFHGLLRAGIKDFAGLVYEDTDGSLLHASVSLLSDLTVLVYRDGKLTETLHGKRSVSYENVSRKPSPYVSSLF